jgi:hypothetical protein
MTNAAQNKGIIAFGNNDTIYLYKLIEFYSRHRLIGDAFAHLDKSLPHLMRRCLFAPLFSC